MTAEATGPSGATVTYTSPATSDNIDPPGVATCAPASGSTFALGASTVTCNATDAAGNAAISTTFTVTVEDTTAPVIAAHPDVVAEATGPLGATVNYTSPATSDAVDGAGTATCAPATNTVFALSTPTTVTCNATDAANNVASSTTFSVTVLDTTAPVIADPVDITAAATSSAGAIVSYPSPATSDAVGGAGTATCLPVSGGLFPLGDTVVTCTATDAANNAAIPATFTVTVEDTTAPIITPLVTGTPGANGWYVSDVTVSWTVTDPETLVTSPTCAPTTLTADTAGTDVSCSATSAGGTSNESVTIKLDQTGPSAVLTVTAGTLGLNGWYTSDVTVGTSGLDDVSGPVDCTDDQVQADETAGTEFNGSCTNDAGLATDAAPLTVKLDKSGPSAVLAVTAGTEGNNGWYTSDVTVSTSGDDGISGLGTCSDDQFQTDETAGTEFNGSCTNGAGLSTSAEPLTVKLDKSAPSAVLAVTAGTLGANGWYISDVTVGTSGDDDVSGVVGCTPAQYLTSDSAGTDFNGGCINDAGLSTQASPLTVKLDETNPGITWNGGPAAGGSYYFGFVPGEPTCTATDSLSGPDGCSVLGYSAGTGSHTMTASAKDVAGNSKVEPRAYTVSAWTLGGFYQPVDMDGVWNTVKGGATVPLKFEVFASAELTDIAAVDSFTVKGVACPGASVATDDIELVTTGGTTLRYDSTGGQFIQNWQTPKKPGACYTVTMKTDDGSSISANFKLK